MKCVVAIIFALTVVALADVNSPDVEESAVGPSRYPRAAGGCSYSGCNEFCRKLGHARGVCIGTYCQCRMRLRRSATDIQPLTQQVNEVQPNPQIREARSCGYNECNQHCRKLGYARGVCIGTYCQCRMR